MSRPFQRSTPNLYNADYIRNKKNKVLYNHIVNVVTNDKCSSSDGKTRIDCSGYLLHTNNHEMLRSLRYGAALCAPCDISGLVTEPGDISGILDKCICRIPMTIEMRMALYYIIKDHLGDTSAISFLKHLENYGIGPDFFYLPWNPFEKPGAHNADKTWWTPPCIAIGMSSIGGLCKNALPIFYLQDASSGRFGSCPFPDISGTIPKEDYSSQNILPFLNPSGDCSGATCGPALMNIYGAYIHIFNPDVNFGNKCGSTYLPEGTFAFNLKTLISTWLYLWEPISIGSSDVYLKSVVAAFNAQDIYAARPPTTIDNYLDNFAQKAPLRIYRSKYWHA